MIEKGNYTYFSLDGTPCRVLNYGDVMDQHASCYVKGKGFVDANLFDVTMEGVIISEDEFKQMVVSITQGN